MFLTPRPNEDPKYTGGVITFDLLEDRPGQGVNGSFSVDLRHFLLASGVRIRLEGHPYLPNNDEKRHTYHGIIELRVEAMYVRLENGCTYCMFCCRLFCCAFTVVCLL